MWDKRDAGGGIVWARVARATSTAPATAFRTESRYLRKKPVTVPTDDMIRMMHTTTGRATPCRFSAETASRSFPCTPRYSSSHRIDAVYMNAFCRLVDTFWPVASWPLLSSSSL